MQVFGVVGWSGSGCTSLLSRLSKYFSRQGLRVSAVKQSMQEGEWARPPADACRLHREGCVEVVTSTPQQWCLSRKIPADQGFGLNDILEAMAAVDLVLVEGFKQMSHPKILAVHPQEDHQLANTQLLAEACPRVVALAAKNPHPELAQLRLPVFEIDDTWAVAEFMAAYSGLPHKASVTAISG